MRVLGICGSLRRESYNRRLLAAAAKELPDTCRFLVFEEIAEIPLYDEDIDARQTPPAVAALRGAIATADAILIATPEYNASVPGVLKNAIDWASRPYPDHVLRGKPVMVAGASSGAFGATLAQTELRRILKAIGAQVLEGELPVPDAQGAFAADGRLANPQLQLRLSSMVFDLVNAIDIWPAPVLRVKSR